MSTFARAHRNVLPAATMRSRFVEQTRQGYAGRVEISDDFMVIEIGAEIQVVRATSFLPR